MMKIKSILKSPLIFTLGSMVILGSYIGSAVPKAKAKDYVDEVCQKNISCLEVVQESEETLWDTYMKGAINKDEFTDRLAEINSLNNKIEIVNKYADEDSKLELNKILKKQKTADDIAVFGGCLAGLGLSLMFVTGLLDKPKKEKKLDIFNMSYPCPKSNVFDCYDECDMDYIGADEEPSDECDTDYIGTDEEPSDWKDNYVKKVDEMKR